MELVSGREDVRDKSVPINLLYGESRQLARLHCSTIVGVTGSDVLRKVGTAESECKVHYHLKIECDDFGEAFLVPTIKVVSQIEL